MSTKADPNHDEAQDILDALRQIQDSPELQAAAATQPASVLNRLKLSGVARHAVAFGIAARLAAPVVSKHIVTPDGFWGA